MPAPRQWKREYGRFEPTSTDDLELTDAEACGPLATDAAFVGRMLLETVGVTGLVR